MTLNISQIIDTEYKKQALIKLLQNIEPSDHFHVDLNVSASNKKLPLLAHIHAMINKCAYRSGLDPSEMKKVLKGEYLCDIMRSTDDKFKETVETYESESGISLKGEVYGVAMKVKYQFGNSVSMSPKSGIKLNSLRFFRQKVEEHLGTLEGERDEKAV